MKIFLNDARQILEIWSLLVANFYVMVDPPTLRNDALGVSGHSQWGKLNNLDKARKTGQKGRNWVFFSHTWLGNELNDRLSSERQACVRWFSLSLFSEVDLRSLDSLSMCMGPRKLLLRSTFLSVGVHTIPTAISLIQVIADLSNPNLLPAKFISVRLGRCVSVLSKAVAFLVLPGVWSLLASPYCFSTYDFSFSNCWIVHTDGYPKKNHRGSMWKILLLKARFWKKNTVEIKTEGVKKSI